MFTKSTSQDHSASNSRRNWTIGAWVMGILILTAATPALANDNGGPRRGGNRQVQNTERFHGNGNGNYRNQSQRQFEKGLRAGRRAGQLDGFEDGKCGSRYNPKSGFGGRNRSKAFKKGYRRAYRSAYEAAFHKGQHQRQHDRQNRRRRWIWSIGW